MKFPCEVIVREVLPSLRAIISRELARKYKLTQPEIASRLGITQASVSYYLSSKRGYSTQVIERSAKLREVGKKVAGSIVEGTISSLKVMEMVCGACRELRRRDIICELHEEVSPSLKGEACRLCESR